MRTQSLPIDTNLLLLWVVGSTSQDYILRHKKLTEFTVRDYDELVRLIDLVDRIEVTPHILAETSNLAGYIAEPARTAVFVAFARFIGLADENHVPAKIASEHGDFARLGLTDVAAVIIANPGSTLLTSDLDLYIAAVTAGIDSINFNHLRDEYL